MRVAARRSRWISLGAVAGSRSICSGRASQRARRSRAPARCDRSRRRPSVQRQQRERRDLAVNALVRGDADLGTGVQVDAAVRPRARSVEPTTLHDARASRAPRACASRMRGQRVGRLARLRDGDDQRAARRRPGCGSGTREAYSTSTGIRASSSSRYSPISAACQRGAAGGDDDALDVAQLVVASGSGRRARAVPSSSSRRPRRVLRDRLRLLEDLLEHEVRRSRPARSARGPSRSGRPCLSIATVVEVEHAVAVAASRTAISPSSR